MDWREQSFEKIRNTIGGKKWKSKNLFYLKRASSALQCTVDFCDRYIKKNHTILQQKSLKEFTVQSWLYKRLIFCSMPFSFEKRAEYERDVRARNVTALHRNEVNEDATPKVVPRRKEKEEKSEVKSTVKSWRERREAAKASQPAEPEPERKSWREKLAEKQAKDEEEQKQREADAAAAAKVAAEAKQKAEAAGEAETSAAPAGDQPAAPQEEDDASGTKKLKSDFNFMMSGLDAEFEAGRSKLAKLRERIRKAKAAIKEADDAMAEDERLRQEAIAAKKAARAQQQA